MWRRIRQRNPILVSTMAVRSGVFVVFLAIAVVFSADDEALIKKQAEIAKKCMADGNVTPDDIRAFLDKKPYPDSVKCVMKCFMVSTDAMKDDGTFNVDTITAQAGEDKKDSVKKCAAQATKTDSCERAEEYELCFLGEQPDFYKMMVNRVLGAM